MNAGPLIQIDPSLDRGRLAAEFKKIGRLQIRDVLTLQSARSLRDMLQTGTPWGMSWQAADDGPHHIRAAELARLTPQASAAIQSKLLGAARGEDYAFAFAAYPLVQAYLERWSPGSPQEQTLEQINSAPFLDFMREVTGISALVKADAQATLYGPGHFLSHHDDSEEERGRRVAYVLNLTIDEWRPEWGGYLNFFDESWDVIQAFAPRFNSLNLFRVPQLHSVGHVAPFAPNGRYAITGWARDR